MKMRQNSFRSGQLHSWLVVSLSLLLIVGEPAILRAGPCEDDCENKKAKALAACDITFSGNETKCLIQATADQRACNIKLKLAIENAERLALTATTAAAVVYHVGVIGCIVILNPACYMTNFLINSTVVTVAQISLLSNLAAASHDADGCNKIMLSNLGVCRQKRDIDLAVAQQIANDDYGRCKNNCGGNNGAGDNGGG